MIARAGTDWIWFSIGKKKGPLEKGPVIDYNQMVRRWNHL